MLNINKSGKDLHQGRTSRICHYWQQGQKFKLKTYQKNRRVHTVSKTRLKFSISKFAYTNTLNNFLYFSLKKYEKKFFFEFGPFFKML